MTGRRIVSIARKQLLSFSNVIKNVKMFSSDARDSSSRFNSEMGPMRQYEQHLQPENPIKRTGKIIKNDIKLLSHKLKKLAGFRDELSDDLKYQNFATHTDILIIGGGIYANSIAFWLKNRAPHGFNVTVVDNDSSGISSKYAMLHHQFSLPENVLMSLFGAEFLESLDNYCTVDDYQPLNVQYSPCGCLFLSKESEASMWSNADMQSKLGARNILLSQDQIQMRFPWLNVQDISLGCLGLEKEGTFNANILEENLRRKSMNLGAEYVDGQVVGLEFKHQPHIIAPNKGKPYEQIERVVLKLLDNKIHAIKFGYCIFADELHQSELSEMAGLGLGEGLLSVPLNITSHKKKILHFEGPEIRGVGFPAIVDPSGVSFHFDGLLGRLYVKASDDLNDLDQIKKLVASRLNFKCMELTHVDEEYDEFNHLDTNGILGGHPYYHNLMIASGFSTHGAQNAPAVGRAMMELLVDGEFKSINLSRFGFDRLCLCEPLDEDFVKN